VNPSPSEIRTLSIVQTFATCMYGVSKKILLLKLKDEVKVWFGNIIKFKGKIDNSSSENRQGQDNLTYDFQLK